MQLNRPRHLGPRPQAIPRRGEDQYPIWLTPTDEAADDVLMLTEPAPSSLYSIQYFCVGEGPLQDVTVFKKVDFPGRSRAETFVLQGRGWMPALGLRSRLLGVPEWTAQARAMLDSELANLLRQAGWSEEDVDGLMSSHEGQRRYPRRL